MPKKTNTEFVSVNIAVLTVSDTRTEENDTSGQWLVKNIEESGHKAIDKKIVTDDIYKFRAILSDWIAKNKIQVVITTGGTGLTGRDITPEAVMPLFDKEISGFGETFRWLSFENVKTSTIQSRAVAGVANGTFIFCLPGSTGACKDGWDGIIKHQLNSLHGPCNLIEIMPRLKE